MPRHTVTAAQPAKWWATNDPDAPCPCGVSHTRAEHSYDPDIDDGPDPDDHGPGCDGPYNCTCTVPLFATTEGA